MISTRTLLLLLGVVLFFMFLGMEQSPSGATVHWFIALLYMLGGKWLVAGVCGFLGTLMLISSVVFLFPQRKKP